MNVSEEEMVVEAALFCLVQNIYFEARNQSTAGQIAVTQVVMNRVHHEYYPSNVCEVIKQGPTFINWKGNELPVKNKCQFSWYCDGKSDVMLDHGAVMKAMDIAFRVYHNEIPDLTDGATHYHAVTVYPKWVFDLSVTSRIDDHIFYK